MKVDVLVAEIGSTTTVVNAFKDLDTENPIFWAQGQAPTSVLDGDVRIGLQGAIDDLCKKMGIEELEYDEMLATSQHACNITTCTLNSHPEHNLASLT